MTGPPPNPGSDDAILRGCLCPVHGNNYGRTPPCPPSGWWITPGCPVHAAAEPRIRRLGAAA
jgi:hypothetical protein